MKSVLQGNEDARNDDMVLYLALCNLYLKDAGTIPLAEIMTRHKELGFYQSKNTPTAEEMQEKAKTETVSQRDQEMILKLLANPEMAALLKTLAKNLLIYVTLRLKLIRI